MALYCFFDFFSFTCIFLSAFYLYDFLLHVLSLSLSLSLSLAPSLFMLLAHISLIGFVCVPVCACVRVCACVLGGFCFQNFLELRFLRRLL